MANPIVHLVGSFAVRVNGWAIPHADRRRLVMRNTTVTRAFTL